MPVSHPKYATDEMGRVKVGVRMSPPTEGEASRPLPRSHRFLSYSEDVGLARMDAVGAMRFCDEKIEEYKTLAEQSPDGAQVQAERDYGSGTTVEDAIGELWGQREDARCWLRDLADDPSDRYHDFVNLINGEGGICGSPRAGYFEAAERFLALYPADSLAHTEWLFLRSCVTAEREAMGADANQYNRGWGKDGVWRGGERAEVRHVDPADPTLREPLLDLSVADTENVRERSLQALARIAIVVRYHEESGDEGRQAYWRFWMDNELSAHAMGGETVVGIDFEFHIDEAVPVPATKLIEQWEDEVNVLDSEDSAKLRRWEAVTTWATDDAETAEWYEQEAEETRLWALEKRSQIARDFARSGLRRPFTGPVARRRSGARARSSRGRAFRTRGSRRVTSRSASGPGSGDDPDPEPSARTGAYGVDGTRAQWDATMVGLGIAIGAGVMDVKGMIIGGCLSYLWARLRWPGDS
jgi:hypothetical protein